MQKNQGFSVRLETEPRRYDTVFLPIADWLDGNRPGLHVQAVLWSGGLILWGTWNTRYGISAGFSPGSWSCHTISTRIEGPSVVLVVT